MTLLLAEEVAAQLQVSERTVRRLVKAGRLERVLVGRQVRFRQQDVDRYVRSQVGAEHVARLWATA